MVSIRSDIVVVGCNEMSHVPFEAKAQPHFVFFDKRENTLVGNGVLVTDDNEFLIKAGQLTYILTEQGKRWIGDDNVSLFQQGDTLRAAEVTIALQGRHAISFGILASVRVSPCLYCL